MVFGIDQLRGEAGFLTKTCNNKHLGLSFAIRKLIPENILPIAGIGKIQQPLRKILMVGSRLDIHQLHIHVRTLQTDITSGLVIGDLVIEGSKLRDFNEVPEPLLHDNLPSDINLIVAAFLRKDSGPRIKAVDILMGQSIWTQILEQ